MTAGQRYVVARPATEAGFGTIGKDLLIFARKFCPKVN